MSQAVGHERIGQRRLALVLFALSLMSTIDAQHEGVAERKREQVRIKDQQVLRSKSTGGPELENICDVQTSLSVYCICDSMSLNDATEARCTVFNVSDQNDSIWESFRTQAGILDLKLTIHEDGLHFLPTAVLRNLPSLTTLQVQNASIETLAPHTFADVDQLSELKLNRNKVK